MSAHVPWIRNGNLLFVSGHIAKRGGQPWTGQLGSSLTTSIGAAAARAAAEDLISTLHAATHDLNAIEQVLKLVVLVNSTATFTDHHLVANGASDLMTSVFGKVGSHARTVFGVAQLPYGACVEIEAIVRLRDEIRSIDRRAGDILIA
jgi:enamine deaminase RidA (YjgF/YER057c/UK114 family)